MKTNEYKLKVIAFRAPCERLRLRIGSIFHLSKSDTTNFHRGSGQLANAQKLQFFSLVCVFAKENETAAGRRHDAHGYTIFAGLEDVSAIDLFLRCSSLSLISLDRLCAAALSFVFYHNVALDSFALSTAAAVPQIRLQFHAAVPDAAKLTTGNMCFCWWIAVGTRSERTVMHASGCPDSSGDFCPLSYSSDRN